MKNKALLAFFVVFSFLLSCGNQGEVYYRFQSVKNNQWNRTSSIDFLLDSLHVVPEKKYDLMLEVVNSNQYPYQNIWLLIQQNMTDTVFVTDTVEVKLTDSNGKWLGQGSIGLYQLSVPYKSSIVLDSTRSYLIRFRQGMRDNSLKGIEKVGVRVKAAEM